MSVQPRDARSRGYVDKARNAIFSRENSRTTLSGVEENNYGEKNEMTNIGIARKRRVLYFSERSRRVHTRSVAKQTRPLERRASFARPCRRKPRKRCHCFRDFRYEKYEKIERRVFFENFFFADVSFRKNLRFTRKDLAMCANRRGFFSSVSANSFSIDFSILRSSDDLYALFFAQYEAPANSKRAREHQ